MSLDSYINVPRSDHDKFVYRIVGLCRLYDLFQHEQNVLVKPERWDDPYENLRAQLQPSGSQYHCYGQCWTLQRASDAMWRIYSPGPVKEPDKRAVRIRSTIRKLLESLIRSGDSTDVAFIGRVRYLSTPKLTAYVREACTPYSSARSAAETLLVKRPAFKHELEVRLLLISSNDANAESGLYRYDVDPNALIDQIMIDPRVDDAAAEALKAEIRSKTQFRGEIKRSLLYAPPKL
jgi:hypothetical protein